MNTVAEAEPIAQVHHLPHCGIAYFNVGGLCGFTVTVRRLVVRPHRHSLGAVGARLGSG
jgi:hypothetical protein